MSTETNEKHESARKWVNAEGPRDTWGEEQGDEFLSDALDEIERLRGLADDPAAVDLVARELCDSARLPGAWDMSDEFDRESFRKEASNLLRAALSPEEDEQA